MSTQPASIEGDVRQRILKDPEVILRDRDLMAALVARHEAAAGGNVVDLRGLAMARLEERLDRLEETHRSVIAAAYENLAGTNQIHRAVLRLMDPAAFEGFMADLGGEVAEILRVESVRLVLEGADCIEPAPIGTFGEVLQVVPRGFVDGYAGRGRPGPARCVTLRQMPEDDEGMHVGMHGPDGEPIGSEAVLALDLGEGRLPAALILGCEDPHQFKPGQATDLLAFFAGVFERALRRWLA
ncbi:hypothetical protein BCF33_1278 [Hasllibacter halocynthiae]|uniref:DUF484 family protein n=1 Tax=Hasllibacter halocynthiae TaxID=595589 RepID=A0A2T0X9P4_9RHOB|nr:DUF484 family protein [Hasllibacter halocynthiae]PRY95656.1 hypothetical protein BCF33_1278 [Hasllibacter halocynthiae]